MRKALLIILGIFCIASLFADPVIKVNEITVEMLNYLIDKAPDKYVPPSIAIGPYDSTSGINMQSKEYPRREQDKPLQFVDAYTDDKPASSGLYYTNGSMVALGALYDVPVIYKTKETQITGTSVGDEYGKNRLGQESGINKYKWEEYRDVTRSGTIYLAILSNDKPAMQFSAESSSDFMFVSQSHPTYRRPFELAIQPKYLITNYANYLDHNNPTGIALGVKNLGNGLGLDNNPSIKLPDNVRLGLYASFWFDVILVLPFDNFDVTNGVQVDNVKYELIEAEDYSSIVNLSVSFADLEYELYEITFKNTTVQRREGIGGVAGYNMTWNGWYNTSNGSLTITSSSKTGTATGLYDREVITIPFSGYYSPYDSGMEESRASFHVSTYPIISSLSLNPSSSNNPRTFIDIADINLIYMFGDRFQTDINDNTCEDVTYNPRIFLSASSDPKKQNANGFMFIYRGATRIVEGVNAVKYTVRVTDDSGSFKDFDGTDYIDGTTYEMVGEDKFLYSEHHYSNPFWHVYDNGPRQIHYHSYDGTISILIDDTDGNLMQAGAYESTIYVHLITP